MNLVPPRSLSLVDYPLQTPTDNLFVCYLPKSIDDARLHALVSQFGVVVSAKVMRHPATNETKGFGFALLANISEATKAKDALHGVHIDNKTLLVRFAPLPNLSLQNKEASTASSLDDPSAWEALCPLWRLPGTRLPLSFGRPVSPVVGTLRNLYIKGIPPSWNVNDFRSFFSRFGEIEDAIVLVYRGVSKCIGLVKYKRDADTQRVLLWNGQALIPQWPTPIRITLSKSEINVHHQRPSSKEIHCNVVVPPLSTIAYPFNPMLHSCAIPVMIAPFAGGPPQPVLLAVSDGYPPVPSPSPQHLRFLDSSGSCSSNVLLHAYPHLMHHQLPPAHVYQHNPRPPSLYDTNHPIPLHRGIQPHDMVGEVLVSLSSVEEHRCATPTLISGPLSPLLVHNPYKATIIEDKRRGATTTAVRTNPQQRTTQVIAHHVPTDGGPVRDDGHALVGAVWFDYQRGVSGQRAGGGHLQRDIERSCSNRVLVRIGFWSGAVFGSLNKRRH